MQHIQMQLPQERKPFYQFFIGFLKSSVNFEHFQKKDDSLGSDISEITDSEKHG